MQSGEKFQFGDFQVDPLTRTLRRREKAVTLNRRAFDVLLYFIQNPGRVLGHDEVMKNVWPDTFVDENSLAQSISALRRALEEKPGDNSYIITLPGRGYQFISTVKVLASENLSISPESVAIAGDRTAGVVLQRETIRTSVTTQERDLPRLQLRFRTWVKILTGALCLAIVGGIGYFVRIRSGHRLTEKDTIVLGEFDNKTGDPVFDGTLRQGLSAQLEQSPFLNLLSDRRIVQTLSLMTQPKDSRLTPELAREVCQRTASAAVLNPSIAQIGTDYLLTLKAIDCSTGDSLASAEAEARDKNHVLDALGKIAAEIRGKLGESLASVQKYDVPPADVTTSSLDALHTYTLAMNARTMNFLTPIQIMQHAIEQDPNFAMAYAQLGVMYINIAETQRGADAIRKAYALRDRVSEREKLYISSHYDQMVTGDLLAARKDYELWEQIYPRDVSPPSNLGIICLHLGDFDKVFSLTQKAISLSPKTQWPSSNEIWTYIFLNRIDEAKTMILSGLRIFDDPGLHATGYTIAFLQRDFEGMQREAKALVTNSTWGDSALNDEANTAWYFGQFAKSRELTQRAVDAAQKVEKKESAATYQAEAAIREALAGNVAAAKRNAKIALALTRSRDVEAMSALALSLAGDSRGASQLATELDKEFPQNTILQLNYLPTIRAAMQLWNEGGKLEPAKAIETLVPVKPYELGITALDEGLCMYPVYVRGQALLLAKDGPAAEIEFQKIIQHPGVVQNEPIGALAYLSLARAFALSHDSTAAKTEYQNFLSLWKDADPDVLILKQAKAEYAKLQ